MGKRVPGLRSVQKDDDYLRRKKFEAEKMKVVVDPDKIFDKNGKLILNRKQENKKERTNMRKIKCVKCGEEKGISSRRLKRCLAKYENVDALRAAYLCRKCRSKKEKKPTSETKKKTAEELFEEERVKDPKGAAVIDRLVKKAEETVAENAKNI